MARPLAQAQPFPPSASFLPPVSSRAQVSESQETLLLHSEIRFAYPFQMLLARPAQQISKKLLNVNDIGHCATDAGMQSKNWYWPPLDISYSKTIHATCVLIVCRDASALEKGRQSC